MMDAVFDRLFLVAKQYTRIEVLETEFDDLSKVILRGAIVQAERYTGFSFSKKEERFKARNPDNLFVMPSTPTSTVRVYSPNGVLLETHPAGQVNVQVGRHCMDCCMSSVNSYLEFRYTAGACSFEDIPSDIIMGILRYFAYTYENRGDANNLNLVNINNALNRSGAMDEWRGRLRLVG